MEKGKLVKALYLDIVSDLCKLKWTAANLCGKGKIASPRGLEPLSKP